MRVLCETCRHIVTVDLNDVSCPRCGAPFQHLPRDLSGWRPADAANPDSYLIPLLLWQTLQDRPYPSYPSADDAAASAAFEPGGGEYGGGGATETIEPEPAADAGESSASGEGAAGESA